MNASFIPRKALEVLVKDASERDLATARRVTLLLILLQERYLSRQQLIVRVESVIGKGCFGASAWEDVFYRDMRVVKEALRAAGYQPGYSRNTLKPGYYLIGQPVVSPELVEIIRSSIAEVDERQLGIFRSMTASERFRLGCSVSDTARKAVAYRIQQRFPGISQIEASILALQGGERDE